MTELLLVGLCALLASVLTFFTGFGLGTLLMPVIAIFFPVPIAIAMTGFVHLINSLFKLLLLRKKVNWRITLQFGLPATLAAIPGAGLLAQLSHLKPLYSYHLFHLPATIQPVKLAAGILLIIFATVEWLSIEKKFSYPAKWLPIGGLLSGFFGGLSGQQGALRTPFLLHIGLDQACFIGTGAAIGVLVDISRLLIYSMTLQTVLTYSLSPLPLVTTALAACGGVVIGTKWLKKTTLTFIQSLVALMLYVLGALLCLGVI